MKRRRDLKTDDTNTEKENKKELKAEDRNESLEKQRSLLWKMLIPFGSVALSFLWNVGLYITKSTWYEFLGIPSAYVEMEKFTLYRFFIMVIILLFIIIMGYIYGKIFGKYFKSKIKGKLLCLCLAILVPLLVFFLFTFYLLIKQNPLELILKYYFSDTRTIIYYVTTLSLCIYLIIYSSYLLGCLVEEIAKSVNRYNFRNVNNILRKNFLPLLFMVALIFVLLAIWGKNFYRTYMNTNRKIQVVEDNSVQYFVAGMYGDNWILKECLKENENIYINRDSFYLMNIKGKRICYVENALNFEEALVSGKEFREMSNSE